MEVSEISDINYVFDEHPNLLWQFQSCGKKEA